MKLKKIAPVLLVAVTAVNAAITPNRSYNGVSPVKNSDKDSANQDVGISHQTQDIGKLGCSAVASPTDNIMSDLINKITRDASPTPTTMLDNDAAPAGDNATQDVGSHASALLSELSQKFDALTSRASQNMGDIIGKPTQTPAPNNDVAPAGDVQGIGSDGTSKAQNIDDKKTNDILPIPTKAGSLNDTLSQAIGGQPAIPTSSDGGLAAGGGMETVVANSCLQTPIPTKTESANDILSHGIDKASDIATKSASYDDSAPAGDMQATNTTSAKPIDNDTFKPANGSPSISDKEDIANSAIKIMQSNTLLTLAAIGISSLLLRAV